MKYLFYILLFTLSFGAVAHAQDEEDDRGGKLREKMVEYIQNKLSLSKAEAEKFQPVFFDYLKQLRHTRQEFRDDKLVLAQKVSELRVRFRDQQFKPILGERRSNEVFKHEVDFIQQARAEYRDRLQDRGAPGKRFRSPLLQ